MDAQYDEPPRPRYRILRRIILIGSFVLLVAGIGAASNAIRQKPPVEPRERPEILPVVEIIEATRQDFTLPISAYGNATAAVTVQIMAEVSGKVTSSLGDLQPGTTFEKGQVLLRIDTANLRRQLTQAEARLESLESQLESLDVEAASLADRLQVLRDQVRLAEQNWDRYRTLYADGATSQAERERVEAEYLRLRDQDIALTAQVDQLPKRRNQLESDIESQQAQIELIRLDLDRSVIRAPFRGVVRQGTIPVESFVNARQPLMQLERQDTIDIVFGLAIDEYRLLDSEAFPDLGQTVTIRGTTDRNQNAEWTGSLFRDESQVDDRSRTITLRARVTEPINEAGQRLIPGLFCEVEIPGRTLTNVFVMPRTGLDSSNARVFVLTEANELERRAVTIVAEATADQDLIVISEGLSEGDRVVATPMREAMPGEKVTVAGENPPEEAESPTAPANEKSAEPSGAPEAGN